MWRWRGSPLRCEGGAWPPDQWPVLGTKPPPGRRRTAQPDGRFTRRYIKKKKGQNEHYYMLLAATIISIHGNGNTCTLMFLHWVL